MPKGALIHSSDGCHPLKVVLLMRCAISLCKLQQATMFYLSDAIRFAQ